MTLSLNKLCTGLIAVITSSNNCTGITCKNELGANCKPSLTKR